MQYAIDRTWLKIHDKRDWTVRKKNNSARNSTVRWITCSISEVFYTTAKAKTCTKRSVSSPLSLSFFRSPEQQKKFNGWIYVKCILNGLQCSLVEL